jgi:hypothetical protein
MSRRAALVAAALLAACQVKTDGARCDANASDRTLSCPSGQACGNDGTCSARAATCADRCTPGAVRCGTGGAVERCTGADAACGAWIADACEAGLTCDTHSGAPACECLPPDGAVLVADPAGSAPGALPYATGRDTPARCRFARLGDALAAAAAAKQPITVSARSGPFGDATGETFPLDVAPGVSLQGDGSGGVSIATAATVQSSMLVLHAGATLRSVTLSNRVGPASASASAPTAAVALACDPAPAPPAATLEGVTVDTDALTRGVAVTCPATLTDVRVSGARGPALYVNPPDAAYETTVVGGRFGESTTGVEVRGGALRLAGSSGGVLAIEANAEHGIAAIGSSEVIALQLEQVSIAANGGTGLRADQLPPGSSVSIHACEISGNKGSVAGSQYDTGRTAGGVIIKQSGTPTFSFTGNVVACNGGDQIGFYVGALAPIRLGGGACDASANIFQTTLSGKAINVNAGSVATIIATYNTWAPDPPNVATTNVSWDPTCKVSPAPQYCP